jgi:hypothetical protein
VTIASRGQDYWQAEAMALASGIVVPFLSTMCRSSCALNPDELENTRLPWH